MPFRDLLSLPIIIAGVFALGFGSLVVLNIVQHTRAEQDKKLLQGEITDLRYQVKQDRLAAKTTPTPTPTPEATNTPTPTATPTPKPEVAGAQTTAPTATANQFVRIRAKASRNSTVVGSLKAGDVVTLGSGGDSKWQEITTSSGVHGFVYKTPYLTY